MAKLTLAVDDRVIARAKQSARRHGVSISKMVEAYLDAVARGYSVSENSVPDKAAPVLRSVRGILKTGDRDEYRKHLAAKYR
jgi:hypothetical protein